MSNEKQKALNRTLYRRLEATFGHLRVKNAGEKQQRTLTTDLVSGKPKAKITNSGEYYAVCCPLCNDTRFRLYINHRYGTDDEFGRTQKHLAYCYNAGCDLQMGMQSAYEQLAEYVLGQRLHEFKKAEVKEGKVVDVDAIRANWPGKVIRIDKLPSDHEAVRYLVDRDFDPAVIGKFYNVHWCTESKRRICVNRLIIPIYHNRKMVGWQARAAFDCDWKTSKYPKYYTAPGTPRKNILYNFGNAKNYKSIVVTEGVTDVWRIGPQAVCTLGASMSAAQTQLIRSEFKDYSGVLLFDPDVKEKLAAKVKPVIEELATDLKSGFCWVNLPDGKDPGDMLRTDVRVYVKEEAKKAGVKFSWRRRKKEPVNG